MKTIKIISATLLSAVLALAADAADPVDHNTMIKKAGPRARVLCEQSLAHPFYPNQPAANFKDIGICIPFRTRAIVSLEEVKCFLSKPEVVASALAKTNEDMTRMINEYKVLAKKLMDEGKIPEAQAALEDADRTKLEGNELVRALNQKDKLKLVQLIGSNMPFKYVASPYATSQSASLDFQKSSWSCSYGVLTDGNLQDYSK